MPGLSELLRKRRDAVHKGLTEMALDMLLNEMPKVLKELIGYPAGLVLLERMAKGAARRGFEDFLRTAGLQGARPRPEELLSIFVYKGGERLHPFQLADQMEVSRAGFRLRTSLSDPGCVAVLAGTVAGVLDAAGYAARAIATGNSIDKVCSRAGAVYVVYLEKTDEHYSVVVRRCAGDKNAAG